MNETYPQAEQFARKVKLSDVVVLEPVEKDLYGTTSYVVDPVLVQKAMVAAGCTVFPTALATAISMLQDRVDNTTWRG